MISKGLQLRILAQVLRAFSRRRWAFWPASWIDSGLAKEISWYSRIVFRTSE